MRHGERSRLWSCRCTTNLRGHGGRGVIGVFEPEPQLGPVQHELIDSERVCASQRASCLGECMVTPGPAPVVVSHRGEMSKVGVTRLLCSHPNPVFRSGVASFLRIASHHRQSISRTTAYETLTYSSPNADLRGRLFGSHPLKPETLELPFYHLERAFGSPASENGEVDV